MEVVPLRRHDAASVAAAFLSACVRWGPPDVVRSDNGSELRSALTHALFGAFGVVIQHGAVRHPQSQGSVERYNRTLLTIIRKTLDGAEDWEEAVDMLLFHYRIRPHSVTEISPMRAMYRWEPNVLIEQRPEVFSASAWVDRLESRAAEIRDYLEEQLAQMDWIDADGTVCPYRTGDPVLLRQPERHRKQQPPYDVGWVVDRIVTPSTVRNTSGNRSKVVNIGLLRLERSSQARHDRFVNNEALPLLGPVGKIAEEDYLAVEPAGQSMTMRDRGTMQPPLRFQN